MVTRTSRPDVGARLRHGLRTEHDLVGGGGRPAGDRRHAGGGRGALSGDAIDHLAVDDDGAADAGGDGRDAGAFEARRAAARSGSAVPVPLTENHASNCWPYCDGVLGQVGEAGSEDRGGAQRGHRQTAPTRAELTGTAARPRPRSSAWRTPISALGGAPTRRGRRRDATDGSRGRSSRLDGRDHLTAGHRPRASDDGDGRQPGRDEQQGIETEPGVGSASLASPIG